MTTTLTLAMPNFNEPFVIEFDASGDGIGAILSQQGKPIAFMSRALGLAKKLWSTYVKDATPLPPTASSEGMSHKIKNY